jgi:DNA-binding transcriptional ArsR family regulator
MKAGPNISHIASLVGEPARANMLTALMSGKALTATELAHEAGVMPQTASTHLAKLEAGGLIVTEKQGRHRYFQLSGGDVADVLEGLMGLAARTGHLRTRTGPRDPALRRARVCYDHLAGELGVGLYDGLHRQGYLAAEDEGVVLTPKGGRALNAFGIDVTGLQDQRRAVCKNCLDWSARRPHLAGSLGAALLDRFFALKWARREKDSRVVTFSPPGERELRERFAIRAERI